ETIFFFLLFFIYLEAIHKLIIFDFNKYYSVPMKYYVVKIIVSFILMHSFAFSQTKNITIIDKENGKPISEATVSVGYDTSTMRSFTTDHTGTVKVSVKISQQPFYLRATHVGYSSIDTTFIVHDTEGIAFLLSPKSISLEDESITKENVFIQQDRDNFKLNVQSTPLASVSNACDFLKYAPAVESSVCLQTTLDT